MREELKIEIDRMGMSVEDVFARYLAEWRRSDERRYAVKEGLRKLKEEKQVREMMIEEHHKVLAEHDRHKSE